ncbi:MAG: Tad domain-containing protein [Desulfovibrio sp.]|nr:Tad domain-containing protein [Desulfovibrio sp.]MBI4958467.1 Tad domain-containing protein [Desulfovibrio sp.]
MMNSAGIKRPAKGQEGSITVMVALMLPTLALMIMLVLDIGQLIFERVRLQNVADACAYSAATVQAAGLNEIADLNYSAETEYFKLLGIYIKSFMSPFKQEQDGKNAAKFYEDVFKYIKQYQDNANKEYARKAIEVAKSVKKANLDDIGVKNVTIKSINPKTSESQPGKLMEYERKRGYYVFLYWTDAECPVCPVPAKIWVDAKAMPAEYEGAHDGTIPIVIDRFLPLPSVGSFEYKIKKKDNPLTYSAFELKHPPHDLILAPSVFGRTETLHAVAAAMPTGGSVGSMPAADAAIALAGWMSSWLMPSGLSMTGTFSKAVSFAEDVAGLQKKLDELEMLKKKFPFNSGINSEEAKIKQLLNRMLAPTGMDANTFLKTFGVLTDLVNTIGSGDTSSILKIFGIDTGSVGGWVPLGGWPHYTPVMVRLGDLKNPKPKLDNLSKVLH